MDGRNSRSPMGCGIEREGAYVQTWESNRSVRMEYRYALQATGSLGDFSARTKDGREVNGYFDIETPRFAIERGPAWLKIDGNTGLLSGTPVREGKSDVVVIAQIEKEVRKLDEPTLKWGNEKLLSVSKEQVGTATQKFVIEVQ